jgi:hypothetical protein
MLLASTTAGDAARIALAGFLVVVGLGLGYALLRLGGAFARLGRFIAGLEREVLPVISRVGGAIDRVNSQLDKVDVMTDSAVGAVESADRAVRAVSTAVTAPVRRLSGWAAAIRRGAATLRAERGLGAAMTSARRAAREREEQIADQRRPDAR